MKIRLDTYYDVTCDSCARSRSTDFEMGMETEKSILAKRAYSEGWKCIIGKTLCPECVRKKRAGGDLE